MRNLEALINEIKTRGFQKYKNEIDTKVRIRDQLQLSVDNFQKKVNFINSQKKHFGQKNSKIESEMFLYKNLADRWQREIFFMQKETPGLKNEIQLVSIYRTYFEYRFLPKFKLI